MIFRNQVFLMDRMLINKSFWRCKYERKKKCKARLMTYGKTLMIKNGEHTHEESYNEDLSSLKSTFVNIVSK